MKRSGNLFDRIAERENLRIAVHRALHGKRDRHDAREFVACIENNLQEMRRKLFCRTFPLGNYHQFVIHDPKKRIITAPCFQERVLHHAVINVCEPIFERWMIDDTFACRAGKGRVVALQRAGGFARRYDYFLKFDIRKYFDSVPHAGLFGRLERLFKDPSLLRLFTDVVQSFRGSHGRGLPIGSLTSQHFANFYLGWFDRYVKEELRVKGYVRYMDDMVIWCDSKPRLRQILTDTTAFLRERLRLEVKSFPFMNRSIHGLDFLGCRVFPGRLVLNRRSRVRYGRKLKQLEQDYCDGKISERELQCRATALTAFSTSAGINSWKARQRVLQRMMVSGH